MKKNLLLILGLILSLNMMAQQTSLYLGDWKAIDNKTGEANAIINIYRASDGTYFGKIVEVLREDIADDARCTACMGAERNKPIVGMIVLKSMRHVNKELVGGSILDPETGTVTDVKITFEKDGRLKIRGSLDKKGLLGRCPYWER